MGISFVAPVQAGRDNNTRTDIDKCMGRYQGSYRQRGDFSLGFSPLYQPHVGSEFMSNFTHAFLIHDPAKTTTSMHDRWPDFHEGEIGFPEQRALLILL